MLFPRRGTARSPSRPRRSTAIPFGSRSNTAEASATTPFGWCPGVRRPNPCPGSNRSPWSTRTTAIPEGALITQDKAFDLRPFRDPSQGRIVLLLGGWDAPLEYVYPQ